VISEARKARSSSIGAWDALSMIGRSLCHRTLSPTLLHKLDENCIAHRPQASFVTQSVVLASAFTAPPLITVANSVSAASPWLAGVTSAGGCA
jgi:hypothetical protein